MTWLIPSVIATATGTAILTVCYFYLYALDRKNFLKIWAISWAVYFARYVFLLVTLFWQKTPWLLIANQMACLISGILLLYGTYLFINKKFPRILLYLGVLGGLWIFISILNNYSFLAITLPTFSFLAGIYVWTGIVFLQSSQTEKKEIAVVGIGFILWGLHKADYPFVEPVVWFAPWGYLLSAAIEFTVALGLLLVYFRKTKNEMTASEEKFRSLAESSRDYIMRYDRQGRHTYMNPAALAVTGLKEAGIIGKTHREAGFPEHLCAMWEEQIALVFATGKPGQTEFSWAGPAGPVYLDWRLTPELDTEGRVFSVLGVSRDITERRQLENVQAFLAETSSGTAAEPFFYALARFLAENLVMDFVCIDTLEGDGLTARTVAVWHDGQFEDNVSYALKDTPCGEVVGQTICCYTASVTQLFPKDQVLLELQAESYAGVTLFSHTGQPIGLIALISRQPLKDRRLVENTLKMVAVRAAGEMERLDAEDALKTSEKLLRDIAVNIPGALYQFVLQPDGSFAIPYMSEGGSQVLGQPLEVLQDAGRLFTNVHPDDLPGFYSSISESAETMQEWRQEFRVFLPTGETRWLLGISQPSRLDDGGICWNGVLLDITKSKQVEEALLASNRQTSDILESISDAFFSLDDNLVVTYFNPAAEKALGKKASEVLEMPLFDAFPEARGSVFESNYRLAVREKRALFFEVNFNVPPYENCYEVRVYPQAKGISVYFQVITERKRLEKEQKKLQAQLQQAQKMEAIGALAGGIAHDFNNILGAILGYAEMVQEDSPAGSNMRKDIDQVVKASHRAKDLVKQILAFSRQAESDRIPLQPAIIIKEALKMLRASLPTTIAIEQDVESEVELVLADPTQIHQVIVNLCTNAFHAMEETGGTLSVSIKKASLEKNDLGSEPHVQPGDFIQLSIGDTGPGIAPEIREKIFDPYFTTKEIGKGTGMGLAIIHGIVKSYNGFVSCHSRPGEGTVFHVYLPVISDSVVPEPETAPLDLPQLGNERILFIDDEDILAEMGKVMLERLGYRVTVRKNSLEALNTFQNQPERFDLVITDQTMPGMTGSDLARRMLQIRPGMPIILCTGYSSLISEDKAKSLGIKGFAMKPLAKKDIAAIIRKVLDEVR